MQLISVLVRCRDEIAIAVEDESRSRTSDLELREKTREPGIFDDDGKHALALLVDVDRPCKGD